MFNWIQNSSTRNNIETLAKGLNSDQYFAVKKDGKTLKIVDTQSIFSKIKYLFNKESIHKEVKFVINDTIVQLANDKKLCEDVNKDSVRQLFFNHMAHYSDAIFDRSILNDGAIKNRKALPRILNPELDKQLSRLQRRIEKVKLGQKLGVSLQPISQGASGSYFARDYKMKTVGVFKPGNEETSVYTPKLQYRILYAIGNLFGMVNKSTFWPGSGYQSEAMSSKLADHLNLSILPHSQIIQLESEQFVSAKQAGVKTLEAGSFQIFEKNTTTAMDRFNLPHGMFHSLYVSSAKEKVEQEVSLPDFEAMAIVDGLTLNKDRHYGNWLVKNGGRADGTHPIVLIDHQYGFPLVNPPRSYSNYRAKQNLWRKMPQSQHKFSPELKEKIQREMKGEVLRRLIDSLDQTSQEAVQYDANAKTFKSTDTQGNSQELAFKQRVAVLLLAQTRDVTIKEYAKIRSLDEMIAFTTGTVDIQDVTALDRYLNL